MLALPAPQSDANGALPELEDSEPPSKRQRLEPAPSGLGDADEDDEVRIHLYTGATQPACQHARRPAHLLQPTCSGSQGTQSGT